MPSALPDKHKHLIRMRILLGAFVFTLALSLFFGVKFAMGMIYWSDPRHLDQVIEGWMTPGYVAHSWQVPREIIRDGLGLAENTKAGAGRLTLEDIAKARGVTFDVISTQIKGDINRFRAAQ